MNKKEKLEKFEHVYGSLNQCPVTLTLKVIGGKWKPAILYLIDVGINRFGELHRKLPGISKRMLTDHLRELERDGVLHREVFPQVPPKVIYSLTERGESLSPIFKAMEEWGIQYGEEIINQNR